MKRRDRNIVELHDFVLLLTGSWRRLLTNVKGNDIPEARPGAVYKIKCSDYQATYISETNRNLTTRLNEHKRATKKGHTIDWDSATCLTYREK